MTSGTNTPRLLGIAFLIVLITSALSSILLNNAIGSGGMPEIMANLSNNIVLFRISVMCELLTSVGIVVLAALLHAVLREQNRIMARIAFVFWSAEAITLAISKLGSFMLIRISQQHELIKTTAPDYLNALGDIAFNGFDRSGYGLHFLFYCLGGILWFYLFYKSGYVPKILAVWGILAESASLIGNVISLCGFNVDILFFAHIAMLELAIGLWLVFKGINIPHSTKQ